MQKKYFKIVRYLGVFLFFFSIFFSVHLLKNGFWSIDDPYYHAKHSYLMAQTHNLSLVEPWMQFNFLNYAPTDPWWGYHVIMAGLIQVFGIFLGAKIFTAILAGLAMLVFYWLLNEFNAKKPFILTVLFFSSSSFFEYRLFLERPFLLALIILPLAFWLLIKKKNFLLFLLSTLFALLYNLAPLIILLSVFYIAVESIISKKKLSDIRTLKQLSLFLKPFLSSFFGVLLGILLHPQSLNYLNVIYIHFGKVIFLRLAGVNLGIGNEVQIGDFFSFVSNNIIIFCAFIVSIAIFLSFKKIRNDLINLFLFLISGFWFLVALLVPRGGDFWVPFSWLFVVYTFMSFRRTEEYRMINDSIRSKIDLRILKPIIISVLAVLILNNFVQIMDYVYKTNDSEDIYYRQANEWLKNNTEKNSVIFYNNWSYWPRMFFFNDHNRYIAGMDPTFLYEYDKNLFWLWNNISKKGMACDQPDGCFDLSPRQKMAGIKSAIKEKFNSNYIFIAADPKDKLLSVIKNRKQDFEEVFNNGKLLVYKLK